MTRPSHTNTLCMFIALLCLSSILPVFGDSDYCAPFTPSGFDFTAIGADEYHSCCGISANGSARLTQTNGDILQAALVAVPYSSCRSLGSALHRCCPLVSSAPTYTDTTGRSVVYQFQPVSSEAEYTCVASFSAGGCCDKSECAGSLGTDREWACHSGLCVDVPRCSTNILSFDRSMVLFLLPGLIILLELLWYGFGGRLLSFDMTCQSFGVERDMVQVGMFLVRAQVFRCLVIVHFGIAVIAHLWQGGRPPSECAWQHDGRTLEFIFACMYVIVFGIAWIAHSRPLDPKDSYHDVWQDAILYSNFASLFPFLYSLISSGVDNSWLAEVILAQQVIGLRWMLPALLLYPCMSTCPRTRANPAYDATFRFLDLVFWKSHTQHFVRESDTTRRVGYTRLTRDDGAARSKSQVMQLAHAVPGLVETALALEDESEFIAHVQCACTSDWMVNRVRPEYKQNTLELVSPHTDMHRVTSMQHTGGGGGVSRARPSAFDFSGHRGGEPDEDQVQIEMGTLDPATLGQQQVTATVDEYNRIVSLNILMPQSSTPGGGALFLPPASVAGVRPMLLPSNSPSKAGTPRGMHRPTTASILRAYPLPGDSARIHASSRPESPESSRQASVQNTPRKNGGGGGPVTNDGTAMLNPWSKSLSPRRPATEEEPEEEKHQRQPASSSNKPKKLDMDDDNDDDEDEEPVVTLAPKSKRAQRREAEAKADADTAKAEAETTPPPRSPVARAPLLTGGAGFPSSSPSTAAAFAPAPAAFPSSPAPTPPTPLAAENRGRVVDGTYEPPVGGYVAPARVVTRVEIDEEQARKEMEQVDRGRQQQQKQEREEERKMPLTLPSQPSQQQQQSARRALDDPLDSFRIPDLDLPETP